MVSRLSSTIRGQGLQKRSRSHGVFMIKVESLTDHFHGDRPYLSLPIPSTLGVCGRIVPCDGVREGIPAYQVFRKFVNHFPCCTVTRRHDPRLCIERPYHLFPVSSKPMAPDPMILFELLIQLQGSTMKNA